MRCSEGTVETAPGGIASPGAGQCARWIRIDHHNVNICVAFGERRIRK